MFRRNFIYFTCCFALLQISGCGNNDSQQPENAASKNQTTVTNITSNESGQSGLDGYKSFKFGMRSLQIVALPECKVEYDQLINSNKKSLISYQAELAELVATEQQRSEEYRLAKEAVASGSIETQKAALLADREHAQLVINNVDRNSEEYKQANADWSKLGREINNLIEKESRTNEPFNVNPDIANLEQKIIDAKASSIVSQESADQWFKEGHACQVQLFSEAQKLYPLFNKDNKLVSLVITLGAFNNEKFQSIAQSLAEKYNVSHKYTEAQAQSFNLNQLQKIIITYDKGQVALIAADVTTFNLAAAFSQFEFDTNPTTTNRVMTLQYSDASYAPSVEADASKGQIKDGDL